MNDFIVAAKLDQIRTSDLAPRKRIWAQAEHTLSLPEETQKVYPLMSFSALDNSKQRAHVGTSL